MNASVAPDVLEVKTALRFFRRSIEISTTRRPGTLAPAWPLEEALMPYPGHHLAQVNIARARGSMDDPVMAGFVASLAGINALADRSPGFVWRLQTEDGDATAIRPYADDRILINLSVWEDLPQLHAFVFRSAHAEVMRHRREWFERFSEAYVALWWVAAGHRPSVQEAVARLAYLQSHGPSHCAFTFREAYDPRGRPIRSGARADQCPAS